MDKEDNKIGYPIQENSAYDTSKEKACNITQCNDTELENSRLYKLG